MIELGYWVGSGACVLWFLGTAAVHHSKARARVNKEKAQAIKDGQDITKVKFTPVERDQFLDALIAALVSLVAWPLILLGLTVIKLSSVIDQYNGEETQVLRWLKRNPDVVKEICTNPAHRYYVQAKRLASAGKLKLDLASGTLELDGKTYLVETKK